MSSDLVKRLRERRCRLAAENNEQMAARRQQERAAGADRIEALEAEVADLNKRYEDTHARWDKALARAERLREALSEAVAWMNGCAVSGGYPAWYAKALRTLEDDKQ